MSCLGAERGEAAHDGLIGLMYSAPVAGHIFRNGCLNELDDIAAQQREPLPGDPKGILLALMASANSENSSARATIGDKSKTIGLLDLPAPCPLRAKRLPFGLSLRIISPQSTRTAR